MTILLNIICENQPPPEKADAVPDSFKVVLTKNLSGKSEMKWHLPPQLCAISAEKITLAVDNRQALKIYFDFEYYYLVILHDGSGFACLVKDKK